MCLDKPGTRVQQNVTVQTWFEICEGMFRATVGPRVRANSFHLNRNALFHSDNSGTFENTHFIGWVGMTGRKFVLCQLGTPWHFSTDWKLICGDYTWELKIILYLPQYANSFGHSKRSLYVSYLIANSYIWLFFCYYTICIPLSWRGVYKCLDSVSNDWGLSELE